MNLKNDNDMSEHFRMSAGEGRDRIKTRPNRVTLASKGWGEKCDDGESISDGTY